MANGDEGSASRRGEGPCAAIGWANSPWASSYFAPRDAEIGFDLGGQYDLTETVQHWINDGLTAIFFLVVGLEIKRELVRGELSEGRRAALPVAVAIGGMVVPALIDTATAGRGPGAHGWGIPMATDIAFAVGVLALLGDRVPPAVRIVLLAFAIVDDIGAIAAIALYYTKGIEPIDLAIAGWSPGSSAWPASGWSAARPAAAPSVDSRRPDRVPVVCYQGRAGRRGNRSRTTGGNRAGASARPPVSARRSRSRGPRRGRPASAAPPGCQARARSQVRATSSRKCSP